MTLPATEPFVIDLGLLGSAGDLDDGARLPVRLRRFLAAAAVVVLCLIALGGSVRLQQTGLGDPLWTGSVSLNGFTLGAESLYEAATDATVVNGLDLATGRTRWSLPIAGLPDSTTDVGHGVAAVMTRTLVDHEDRPDFAIAFVRERTGAVIGRTTGYFLLPSASGRPLIVFTDRPRDTPDCAAVQTSCVDVAAWDVDTATVTWRLSLPAGTVAIPSFSTANEFDGLAAVADDGSVRLIDLASGASLGSMALSPGYLSDGQVVLTHDALVTALRVPDGVEVTAYRRPELTRMWTVTVPPSSPTAVPDYQHRGGIQLNDCGSNVVCLYPDNLAGRIIETSTGSFTPAIQYELIAGIGSGLFLASSLDAYRTTPLNAGYVVDYTGRVVAVLPVKGFVDWVDNGGRALLTQEGPHRTGFVTVDEHGRQRSIGSVSGTGLSCRARASYLACSDQSGTLRVWRLPAPRNLSEPG